MEKCGDWLRNSGRQCKIFSRISDQESAISDLKGCLLSWVFPVRYLNSKKVILDKSCFVFHPFPWSYVSIFSSILASQLLLLSMLLVFGFTYSSDYPVILLTT